MMEHDKLCYGCFSDKGQENICPYCNYSSDDSREAALYLTPGTMLLSKYLIGKVLGQGGFGITYLGWDVNLDIRIAIKEFFPQGLASRLPRENMVVSYTGPIKEQFNFGVESFLREAKTLARFEHQPNIVTVRDFFKENGTAYMVMSYVEGLTLLDYLTQQGGKISVQKAIDIVMPVLDALREIHKAGIMHRDISPDNIFIDSDGRVILIDFGAARQEMRETSKSLSVILKAGFAPEEQYRSRGKQGPWTDIYAVAATLYRCIAGQIPSEAIDRLDEDDLTPPSQMGIEIDTKQEEAMLKALAVRAGDRFQSAAEFQEALVGIGPPAYAVPVTPSLLGAGAGAPAPLEPKSPADTEAGLSPQANAAAKQKVTSHSSKGLFVGLAIGTIAIIAVIASIGSQQFLTIREITLNHQSIEMVVENYMPLRATILPVAASDRELIWSSSNTRVASVDNQGHVKALDEGSVMIRVEAKEGGAKAECRIKVLYPIVSKVYGDGSEYVGEWKGGNPHGQGTMVYGDGVEYIGEWKDGMFHGQGTLDLGGGVEYIGEWKDGKPHGQGTHTSADGTVRSGRWANGNYIGP